MTDHSAAPSPPSAPRQVHPHIPGDASTRPCPASFDGTYICRLPLGHAGRHRATASNAEHAWWDGEPPAPVSPPSAPPQMISDEVRQVCVELCRGVPGARVSHPALIRDVQRAWYVAQRSRTFCNAVVDLVQGSPRGPLLHLKESWSACRTCGAEDVPLNVKVPADLSSTGEEKWREFGIDACIAPVVAALQSAGIDMRASCCGHGEGTGEILLSDGRTLVIITGDRDDDERMRTIVGQLKQICKLHDENVALRREFDEWRETAKSRGLTFDEEGTLL